MQNHIAGSSLMAVALTLTLDQLE